MKSSRQLRKVGGVGLSTSLLLINNIFRSAVRTVQKDPITTSIWFNSTASPVLLLKSILLQHSCVIFFDVSKVLHHSIHSYCTYLNCCVYKSVLCICTLAGRHSR